jgi:hypothetical protein
MVARWAAILTFSSALALPGAYAHAESPLTPLRFLLGDWEATGTSPGERGGFTFSIAVQDRVMVRTNYAEYPARDGRPASRHDDFMIVYVEGERLTALYVDSEDHVIRYAVQPHGDREVVFISESKPSEPRYRLSYMASADGTLTGRFEIAPPGSAEAFKPYLSWTARRR